MTEINLDEKQEFILDLGTKIFVYLTGLPQEIRPDVQERPGIQILLRILRTRNIAIVPVGKPVPMAQFLASEKTLRTEFNADKTSQDSEDIENLQFGGCISNYFGTGEIHSSISGLKGGCEDAAAAIIVLSRVTEVSIDAVIDEIKEDGGILPEQIFEEGHYLKTLLDMYR